MTLDNALIILSEESIDIIVSELYVLIENLTIWVKSKGSSIKDVRIKGEGVGLPNADATVNFYL